MTDKRKITGLFRAFCLACIVVAPCETLSVAMANGPAYRDHLAGVGKKDPRQRVDISQMPWSAIGRVQTEQGARCTGFLINPSVVETAAHCLWSTSTHRFVTPSIVHFLLAYSGGQYKAHARVTGYVIRPGYTPTQEEKKAGLDQATLFLDHPIAEPNAIFHIGVMENSIKAGDYIMLGGYEQNQPDIITADLKCQVTGMAHDLEGRLMLAHNCAGTHGSSGAPILTNTSEGWQVLGIQTLAHSRKSGGFAVPLVKEDTENQ